MLKEPRHNRHNINSNRPYSSNYTSTTSSSSIYFSSSQPNRKSSIHSPSSVSFLTRHCPNTHSPWRSPHSHSPSPNRNPNHPLNITVNTPLSSPLVVIAPQVALVWVLVNRFLNHIPVTLPSP